MFKTRNKKSFSYLIGKKFNHNLSNIPIYTITDVLDGYIAFEFNIINEKQKKTYTIDLYTFHNWIKKGTYIYV